MRPNHREAAFIDRFSKSYKFEALRGSGRTRNANKRHRFRVPEKNRRVRRIVGGDELGRLEIGDQAQEARVERFNALNATKTTMPVWQPLAGDGGERAHDCAHQSDGNERLN